MADSLRITYFGNCGTIYSIVEHDVNDFESSSLTFGEWMYPFNEDVIGDLVDSILESCGNAFLEGEDIFKVIISSTELELMSTLAPTDPN